MKAIDTLATILLIVGGLNWGLVGIAHFDLVAAIFGDMSILSRIVYSLVGASAVLKAVTWKAMANRHTAPAYAAR
jgi:uncharacterized protein